MTEELNKSTNDTLRSLGILRQTFVAASVMIIVGAILTLRVNTYFILLPIAVSFGLMFAGVVGWCPMIYFLELMPWNKK